MARQKLLYLSPNYPLPVASGSQFRQLNLLQSFARHFDVTFIGQVLDASHRPHDHELESLGARIVTVVPSNRKSPAHRLVFKLLFWIRHVLFAEPSEYFYNTVPSIGAAIRRELESTHYDVLVAAYWHWDPCVWGFSGLKVLDTNDVQFERFERLLASSRNIVDRLMAPRLLRRFRALERDAIRRADIVVAITPRDRDLFGQLAGPSLEQIVIPTGIDTDYFAFEDPKPEPHHVAFYGALSNPMNVDAVGHLIENVLPRIRARVPEVRLTLIGASPSRVVRQLVARHPGVRMTGFVKDIRQPLRTARVVVLPLRIGWGIRGRVFELMSLGIPVVASHVAVAGMGLDSGDGLVLADTPDEQAQAVESILKDDALRDRLAKRGRELAEERFGVAVTYDRLSRYLADRGSA